jgi:hypothetical protein
MSSPKYAAIQASKADFAIKKRFLGQIHARKTLDVYGFYG